MDLIDRRDAIEALKTLEEPAPTAQHLSAIYDCEDVIARFPSVQQESCDGCKWEYTFGYGECHHCRRAYEDMYERGTDE